MNLIIEIGNTNAKIAIFNRSELQEVWVESNTHKPREILTTINFDGAILSGSGNLDIDWWDSIHAHRKIVFSRDQIKNVRYDYENPQSLGTDRLINAWYANQLYPKLNNLIIDTGTCITFTCIDATAKIIGGSISPGLELRAQSLHDYTAHLPKIAINSPSKVSVIGKSTEESIQSGILLGTLYEIDRRIEHYKTIFPNLNIIMTGGSTQFFHNKLNYKIFADNHFTLKGLNELLLNA